MMSCAVSIQPRRRPSRPEDRRVQPVDQRRPEVEGVRQADPGEEADRLERQALVAQPVAEGAGGEEERQARGEAQPQHDGDLGPPQGPEDVADPGFARLGGGGDGGFGVGSHDGLGQVLDLSSGRIWFPAGSLQLFDRRQPHEPLVDLGELLADPLSRLRSARTKRV